MSTAAAAAALSDSARPRMGMVTGRVQALATSGEIPLPSLPTTQITEPEKLMSVMLFAPSEGVEAKVNSH